MTQITAFEIGDKITIKGAGKHAHGIVSGAPRQLRDQWFIQYRCTHSGGERLAPLDKVSRSRTA